jgi:hypothetical protein
MHFDQFSFGTVRIDDTTYEHDVVIDRGVIRNRKKKPSKKFRDDFGHTPLSIEAIPRKCRRLIIGTGAYGRLPVMKEVERGEATQGQIAHSADDRSHQGVAEKPRRHQRNPPRDVLSPTANIPRRDAIV